MCAIKAVHYTTKTNKPQLPKMILLIDISANNQSLLEVQIEKIKAITLAHDGECFVAKSLNKRKNFWKGRANTAAIAVHTNAFKINEYVVIPLDKLANYNDGIEHINIRLSVGNKIDTLVAIKAYFENFKPESNLIKDKITSALTLLNQISNQWLGLLNGLNKSKIFNTQ